MIYSREVEEMCPVAQGVHHGAAPIPEEAKWVQAKEVKARLSAFRNGRIRKAGCEAGECSRTGHTTAAFDDLARL